MTVRTLFNLAAAVSLGLASVTYANPNQELADNVAARLRTTGVAEGANIGLATHNGVITIKGDVVSHKQAEMIVQQALSVQGAVKVETALQVSAPKGVTPVNNQEPALGILPPSDVAMNHPGGHAHFGNEPIPLASPSMPAYDMTGPKLPPHAWPTYAPYPNMSRVAYPEAYPYNAFPFIGPYYPFPKVPMGWRSVKLEWDDGHWYLGRLSVPHDYWRVKFW